MIQKLALKFTDGEKQVTLPAEGITIFVGPNNSGKSLLLREIEQFMSSGAPIADLKILDDLDFDWPSKESLEKDLLLLEKTKPAGTPLGNAYIGRFSPGGGLDSISISRNSLFQQAAAKNKHWFAAHFLRFWMIRLDGRTRFELTNDRPTGDLLGPPQNALAHLFNDDGLRAKVRELIKDAFGLYFVVDPLNGGQLRIRLSEVPPGGDEQSLNKAARDFHSKARYIKDASDGVQAYVGIVTAVLSGEYRTILIDEPEAFLHPPLARKLGNQLATIAKERGGSLFASTHSADFLIGCIQSSTSVRVVRLEFSNGKSKGKVVDPKLLDAVFKNPLMRSANVISSLFHDGVVVTESDNDRAFYSEVYYRLAEADKGLPAILFVNAQNKQTMKDIIGPLRQFGIPAAAISDIDLIKDGGKTWTGWLKAAQVPGPLHDGYANQRHSIHECFVKAGKDMKRDGGVGILSGSDHQAAEQFFDIMDSYGVFAVRRGELENWLPSIGATGYKTEWAVSALEKMGSDPDDSGYVKPTDDDVWKFMRAIVDWVKNPARLGTQ